MKHAVTEPDPPFDLSGYTPPGNAPLRRLRSRLLKLYPGDVAYADARFNDLWSVSDLRNAEINGDWLCRFAESTAAAMRRRDAPAVAGHLEFFSSLLNRCGPSLRNLIDVNYMEDLFFKVDVRSSRWGWRRVPPNLRKLYVDYWSRIVPRYVKRLQPPKR